MIKSYRVGPRELNVATVSSERSGVWCVSSAPTVRACGLLPGAVVPPSTCVPSASRPKFPAAVTTTMSALTARSTASHSGSSR